jgi:protein phosphatase
MKRHRFCLWLIPDGILKQISTDHSWQELYHDKSLPSNVIYNSLGGGKVFIDVHEMTGKIFKGDKSIVCSDGLSDMQTDTEIETIMLSPDYSADKLVEAAREAGGLDNVSVILVEYVLM